MRIIIDSREQLPYEFENSEIGCIPTGDYSIKGLEPHVCVERKTKADAYGSLGHGRVRFEAEWKRMSRMSFAAVVIECSMKDFLTPPEHSRMNPRAAISTLLGWSVKYMIPVFFCDGRAMGKATTLKLLERFNAYFTQDRLYRANRSLENAKTETEPEKETGCGGGEGCQCKTASAAFPATPISLITSNWPSAP